MPADERTRAISSLAAPASREPTAATGAPPFRSEHIGSLLRPPALLEARRDFEEGRLDPAGLRREEDRWIREAVTLQERVGLPVITDGEYRRGIYFGNFPAAVSGFSEMEAELRFEDGRSEPMRYRTPVVAGRLRRLRGIATEEFEAVRVLTRRTVKVTLPSPCSQHFFRWREGVSERAYPDVEEFFADVVRIYREELADLAARGARYVQLDDVSLPLLCDPRHREAARRRGYDPDALVDRYVRLVNEVIGGRPAGLTVGIHLCRGNNQGRWIGEGGYDPVAARVFGGLGVDVFFLEYDSSRAGGFEPLRHMGSRARVVLGLVSTKTPALEPAEDLMRRLEAAASIVPLDRLGLSPQCGFASTAPGNPLTPADQEAKLRLVVDTARRVWGTQN
ncbi:MAG TPA: 5-methyltetrahydropteroyltriglutamate--homocysteine S-methyltransferase [Methylomirabilota bacterium]|nr:5-methyltetrahydropteroyltriglutamate--homocysteine S-methyltransferase [Methylomirabilota bacterium]